LFKFLFHKSILVACVGVFASLVFSFVIFPHLQHPLNLNPDPDKNGELGKNIYHGVGYVYTGESTPAIDRGPVYPYFIAGVFFISGGFSLVAVQIAQSLLFGLTCLVIFLISMKLSNERTAVVIALVCSLHPLLIWYTARIWIETTNTSIITLAVYSTILLFEKLTTIRAFVCGISFGVAILTKSVILLFPIVLTISLLYKYRQGWSKIVFALLLAVILVVAPWTIRNYNVSRAFVPVHVSLGLNLIQGDALASHWTSQPLSSLQLWFKGKEMMDSILTDSDHTPTDVAGDRLLTSASFHYNVTHPMFFLKRTVVNFLTFWYLGESPMKSIFLMLLQIPLLLLTVMASVRFWKTNPMIQPLILLIGYYAILHSMIIGWARYSVPIVPLCIILSVMFLRRKKLEVGTTPNVS
jgi:4-amino-4-deoxy-L-arabinose transferase-like glycosyltransferase